jgi:hypothetical protein
LSLPISQDKLPERIQPEELEVAESYIAAGFSVSATSEVLGIAKDEVTEIIGRRPVKHYINQALAEVGYNHHFKLSALLEKVIDKKMEELEEAEIGSNKDIADLIKLAIEWTKVREGLIKEDRKISVGKQTNVQLNSYDGNNYTGLMEKLLQDK